MGFPPHFTSYPSALFPFPYRRWRALNPTPLCRRHACRTLPRSRRTLMHARIHRHTLRMVVKCIWHPSLCLMRARRPHVVSWTSIVYTCFGHTHSSPTRINWTLSLLVQRRAHAHALSFPRLHDLALRKPHYHAHFHSCAHTRHSVTK